MEWYLMVWKKFAEFNGRSRRKEYWMFFLFNTLIEFALCILALLLMKSGIGLVLYGVCALYMVACIIPAIGCSVRRLHDTDKSGWLFLLVVIPIIGPIVLLVLFMLAGNPGANQYGPDPKLA
ncbi:MAG: DUF805 domain-containing protein [Terracidiphilus sp.]